jgi:hypothetical protein
MRYHHYAIRAEQTYAKWMLDYIRFNGTRHPREMGKPEIERFLSHLAVNRNVASSTQNQAPMNGDETTSTTMHHSFRPPLPDLKSQKHQNSLLFHQLL